LRHGLLNLDYAVDRTDYYAGGFVMVTYAVDTDILVDDIIAVAR
jgi:hypothetical protein